MRRDSQKPASSSLKNETTRRNSASERRRSLHDGFLAGMVITLLLILFGLICMSSDQEAEARAEEKPALTPVQISSYNASIAEHEEEVAQEKKAAQKDAEVLKAQLEELNKEAEAEQLANTQAIKEASLNTVIQESYVNDEKIQESYENDPKFDKKGTKTTKNPQKTTLYVKKYELTENEEALLKRIAMAEAEGESTECKACIMLVVLNRVSSELYPNTVDGVLTAPGQFEPVETGGIWCKEPNEGCEEALELIQGGWDGSEGATYFRASADGYTWHDSELTTLFSLDHTTFYKE
jgi:N-acetylmuramoyl-L-alanine amidase